MELIQQNDVVDVISSYVQLRQRGRTHSGLCPFHNEKTPSFVVYPETQSYYCFGCGAGGDVITFVKNISNLDYIEAVKTLAQRVGMALPDERDDVGKLRSRVLSINKDVARFYFQQMNSEKGTIARTYWRSRGLTDNTIRRFGLGYAPDSFQETREHLKKMGYSEDELIAAGILRKSEKGSTFDFFRHRAMIPIFDIRGNVIAFSGRKLDEAQAGGKYVNSPETLVYKKSKTLFALNYARKSSSKRYILCEGNLDAISLHQAGFDTAIAGCGTALTAEQVKLISEYAEEVVLCFDSDEAGQKATARAIQLFVNSPVKVSVLNIPNAKDPDEFIQKFGAERFKMLVDGSNNAIEYTLLKAKAKYDLKTADGRVAYLKEATNALADKLTPTERDVYAGRIAEETDVDKKAILTQIQASVKAKERYSTKERQRRLLEEGNGTRVNVSYSQGGQKALGVAFAEQQLVGAILREPSHLKLASKRLSPKQFISADMAKVYDLLLSYQGEYVDLSVISEELPSETISLLSRILAQNYDVAISVRDVEMYISRIEESVPVSVHAGEKSQEEIMQYLEKLRNKKS